ncbi:MAG: LytR/AlgR family response regulator transcription factor [Otoolea sp.]|nr:LytTR family DNA-binding domain-containing protein [Clostridiaceae bacterium]MDD6072757.1 LytTR family DNA-binding domain-containing protein [Clostridium sp.]
MKIAVVDDERPARSELVYLIRQCCPEVEIAEADSSERLMELLEETEIDVCFVDIDLGGANGTTLASLIKSRQPEAKIVFATAYREYAVKAFELGAVDYLLKPFDLERLKKTMSRLQEPGWSGTREAEPELTTGKEEASPSQGMELHKIMVNAGAGFQVLDASEIIYIETEKRSCRIHTKERDYIQNESMNYYETRLKACRFFRIHKSFLVNLDYVVEMVPGYNNGYSLKMKYFEKNLLPIGRTQLKEFRQLFGR